MKVVLIALLILPLTVAHLDDGEDKVVGEYLVDFGYSPEQPRALEQTVLALNLVNDSTQQVIEPDSVWIRISKGEDVVFSATHHPEARHINFAFTFPSGGMYEIKTRFTKDGETAVETAFMVQVKNAPLGKGGSEAGLIVAIVFLLALLIIIIFQLIILHSEPKKKRKK